MLTESIRRYSYWLVAVVAVAMLGLSVFALYQNIRHTTDQERSRLRTLATVIAANTTNVIESNRERMQQIAQRPLIQAMDPLRCDPILVDFHQLFPQFANLTTVDIRGDAPCSAVPQPDGKPVNIAHTEFFQRAIALQDFVMGKPFLGPITHRLVSVMMEPVWDSDHRLRGFVGLPLDLGLFDPHLANVPLPTGTRYGLWSQEGILVWRNTDPEGLIGKYIGDRPGPMQGLLIKDGEFESFGTDGVARYYAVTPVPGTGWYAYAGIETWHVRQAVLNASLANLAMTLAGLALVGLLVAYLIRQIGRAEGELIEARDRAEAANRAKSIFLANMSHELRTPLNAILGFAQLMERDPAMPAHQQGNLGIVGRSGRHLLSLINDILEISKIEAGRLTLAPQVCDLPELIESVSESMALRAQGKGLEFIHDIAPDLPRNVRIDVAKLRQILLNLLSNAVKYTHEGEVRLNIRSLARDGGTRMLITVSDTGIGIAPEEIDRIFHPFYQTALGIQQGEGTGLGLTIAREYSELMEGRLEVESAPGQGTTFRLDLPLDVSREAAPVALPQGRKVLGLAEGEPRYRLLIAEDKPDNQLLLSQLLTNAGFEVRIAGDGRQAVKLFESWRPDLIWMDMRMPVLDGYAATREIRALPGGDKLPIVALTASAFEDDRADILAAGCNDMVRKPLEVEPLFEAMRRHLGVRYRYSDSGEAAAPSPTPAGFDLERLPAAILQRLRLIADSLDIDEARTLAAEIEAEHPEAAAFILARMEDYRFDFFTRPGGAEA